MHINELQQQVDKLMTEKGFKDQYNKIRETAGDEILQYVLGALLITEPAEYIDAVKKGKSPEQRMEEAADTILRALNIFVMYGGDAEAVIAAKMEKNFARPYMFGHS